MALPGLGNEEGAVCFKAFIFEKGLFEKNLADRYERDAPVQYIGNHQGVGGGGGAISNYSS